MPRKAQHITRPWLVEAMSRYPGGRVAISTKLAIPMSLLSEYATTDKSPRPKRAIAMGELLGFDGLQCFFGDARSDGGEG